MVSVGVGWVFFSSERLRVGILLGIGDSLGVLMALWVSDVEFGFDADVVSIIPPVMSLGWLSAGDSVVKLDVVRGSAKDMGQFDGIAL